MELGGANLSLLSLPSGLDISVIGGGAGGGPNSDQRVHASRHRKYNFSMREKELLVGLIETHGGVVESRWGDGVTIDQKVRVWSDIQRRFNQQNRGALPRTVSELKKCYWNLKQKAKRALETDRDSSAPLKVDRVLWRIAQLAPEQFEGLFDLHCEVVDDGTECADATVKEESVDATDAGGTRQSDSPLPFSEPDRDNSVLSDADTGGANAGHFLSVEMTDSRLAGDSCSARQHSRSLSSSIPPLHPLFGAPSVLKERLSDDLDAAVFSDGSQPTTARSDKRAAPASSACDSSLLILRKTEHEFRMRLLRQESEFMAAKHRLEMEVLEHQRVFWREAVRRARCPENGQLV